MFRKINNDENIYSTDEQVIGTQIDGKPLYRKVLTGSFSVSNSQTSFNTSLLNIDTIIMMYLFDSNDCCGYMTTWDLSGDKNTCSYVNMISAPNCDYCILEYTKSTD